MNQQRSRRFRSAQEAAQKDADKAELYKMLRAQGQEPEGDGDGPKKTWDSNAITPGTPFMDILAASLRYWCAYKLNTDPAWEKLKIIISDATVPGEGEHKIMQFVRSQRNSPSHDPNSRHVIYGLDADLIMLGLATHEPHFRVLREDVFANDTKPGMCRLCNQPGHIAAECRGAPAKKEDKQGGAALKPFIWLHVGVLREYLAVEMSVPNQPFKFDLERALDDWVFMCFFVGNDFLPHLPSLDIREQGIDTLIAIWRDLIPVMGGYVTKDGHVDLARAQLILEGLAKQENTIFKRRKEVEDRKEAAAAKRRRLNDKRNGGQSGGRDSFQGADANQPVVRYPGSKKSGEAIPDINALPTFAPGAAQTAADPRYMTHDMVVNKANVANKSAAAVLKEKLLAQKNATPKESQKNAVEELMSSVAAPAVAAPSALGKRKADELTAADESNDSGTPGRNSPDPKNDGPPKADPNEMPPDTVRLWEDGYADRYYEQKFKVDKDNIAFRHQVGRDYVEGLAWVLLYYFQGCPSWTWYYPHHYAPFAADFVDLQDMKLDFKKGKPFRPYEQLMGVMPAASNHTIPTAFHPLMTEDDSDIKHFYPEDFEVDLNGKKFAWQGVALLPFIDEKKLLDAMATRYPLLTDDERARNEFGKEALLFSAKHPLYDEVIMNFYSKKASSDKLTLNARVSEGLNGKVEKNQDYLPSSALTFPLPGATPFEEIDDDQSLTVYYTMPVSNHIHKSMLLPGLVPPNPVLDYGDIEGTRSRAQNSGRSYGGVPFGNNRGGRGGRGGGFSYGSDRGNGGNYNDRNGGRYNNDRYGGQNGYDNGRGPPSNQYGGGAPPQFNLPPHLAAQAAQHGFNPNGAGFPPPPPVPGWMPGMPPGPPPPQYGGQNGGYNNGGYNNGGYNNGGYNNGGGHGGRDNYRSNDRGGRGGGGGYRRY